MASNDLREKLFEFGDRKRQDVEKFSQIELANSLAEIEALLDQISSYGIYADEFISAEEGGRYNWSRAANLLLDNKWIDLIQNTSDGNLIALITPDDASLTHVICHQVDSHFSWIVFPDKEEVYLAIRFQNHAVEIPVGPSKKETFGEEKNTRIYLLYSKEALDWIAKHGSFSPNTKIFINPALYSVYGVRDVDEFVSVFYDILKKGFTYLNQWPSKNTLLSWVSEQREVIASDHTLDPIEMMLEKLRDRNQKAAMIAILCSYFSLQMTAEAPNDPGAPVGISYFYDGNKWGKGFFTKDALKLEPLFSERKESKIAVILDKARVYLGQTLALHSKLGKEDSYVSIGINPDSFAKELALSNHQMSLEIAEGKITDAYTPSGMRIDRHSFDALPIDKIMKEKKGFFHWDDEEYFYLRIDPFNGVDFHYLLCNLKEKEFAVITYLEEGTKNLIQKISIHMGTAALLSLIIVLICLNYLIRKITTPIVELAKATDKVKEGLLQQVDLSKVKQHAQGEIMTLATAFENMVLGLQEKERVRAVLNKVVSPQIATQILQAPLELGGEERKMVMLFADIRSFTQMTQNMDPKEVIELLNRCMDKLSSQVDRFIGVIDKYVGDEVMALFGFPQFTDETILQAIYSAISMMEAMKGWNVERVQRGLPPIQIGIGIHVGQVLAGNMGAENRLNYTVLGSAVNLASRLCSIAEPQEILVSKDIFEDAKVHEKILFEEKPPVLVKGFSDPIQTYKVTGKKGQSL